MTHMIEGIGLLRLLGYLAFVYGLYWCMEWDLVRYAKKLAKKEQKNK